MSRRILLLPGDGIGPEVILQAKKVLRALTTAGDLPALDIATKLIGGSALDTCGTPLPDDTLAAAQQVDAVLFGAVGAPQYDSLPNDKKPELGLLKLRQAMGVFANFRPAICYPALVHTSSLKPELVTGLDILIVRELIGGIYFGRPRGIIEENGERVGVNTMRYGEHEIIRLGRAAFMAARRRQGRVCSVEKANVLEVGMLWRDVMTALGRDEFPDVELSHLYADNAAMQLVRAPKQFDVIATGNLFGDVLSDTAAMLTGSIGMLPSASLDDKGRGLYEPVHGSAPDIAGQDKANPLAAILSVEMMLRYSLNAPGAADKIAAAVQQTLNDGYRTADIAGANDNAIGCTAMGQRVLDHLENTA